MLSLIITFLFMLDSSPLHSRRMYNNHIQEFFWAECQIGGTRAPLTSEKTKASQFCIFGCAIYTHVLEKKRTKFEPFSIKGIFIGCSETLKDY